MKRRLLAAVLPVAALVVLAGSGEATSATGEIGATKGKPSTGSPGVRVSVAELTARQRAQDRRIGAKPHGVREKPEPPEEAGAPAEEEGGSGSKLPGPAVPQFPQQSAGEAIGPSSALAAGTSFLGAQLSESGFIPPDSMGSVGPTQALVDVNGRIKVFSKTGTLGGLNVSDSVFWSSVSNGSAPTDPGVEYDRLSQRWIVSAVNVENSNNRVMIAVSSGPTITNSSSFTFYFFNQNVPPPNLPPPDGNTGQFADYPQLGVDKNAVYIGVNEFNGTLATTAFVIRKSSVLSGGPIVVTAFRNLAVGSGAGPWSPQPATDMDPNVNEGYIVGVDNASFSQLDVRRISDPGGTPTISGNLTIPVPATSNPLPVPAQGTSPGTLDALDDRLFEAMIARKPDGSLSLWTAHNIAVDSSGVASSGNRDGDRWYELGTLSATPTLVQSGTLFDPAASSPRFFWIPSIAANGQGHASLNSSAAGSTHFAEIASSGHLATDSTGATQPFDITQTTTSSYNVEHGNGVKRWGDYSQTVVDPTDNQTFWTFQEYTNATDSWGVRAIKLKAPPPAAPTAASPSTIPTNQSSVDVDITGTSSAGSGFFDPGPDSGGPGYPNHIGATITGGVTVNSVTYTDPTHVTLNINTTTAGLKDVTITNPDGQSSTASNLITVGTDTTPPDPPTLTGTSPASPANNNSPKIIGSAEGGSTVKLYTNNTCAGSPVATNSAATFASPGIAVSVGSDTTTTFYATATDASNNPSDCSSTLASNGSITYVEDSTPPAAPSSLASSPVGPANDNNPEISGSAASGSTVKVYKASTTSDCTGGNLASSGSNSDTDITFASPGLTVSVADNSTTRFRATATDAAGNPSSCSSSFVDYMEDSNIPAVPSITATNPASPSNSSTTPLVQGTASADTVNVDVYTQAGCAGSPTTGSKAQFEGSGIQVTVNANQTAQLSARARDTANNQSACSSSFPYTHDNIAPAQPSSFGTSPASPSNNNNPLVTGSAESGSTVRVFKAPTALDCTVGNQVSMGSATTFGSPGLSGGSVAPNSSTTYRATATDAAGNPSGCSSASITYVEDSAAPAEPSSLASSPAGPADDNFPEISGGAEAGSTVRVYRAPTVLDCNIGNLASTGDQATFQAPGPGLTVSVADNSTTTFRATATDAATNASPCSSSSVTYVESTPSSGGGGGGGGQPPTGTPSTGSPADSTAPETTITGGPKKTRKRRPSFSFASSEAGSSFQCQLDAGPFQPCSSPIRPARKLKLGKHKLKVEAIDTAGNVDPTPAVAKFKVLPPS
jgi:hypothetical protein